LLAASRDIFDRAAQVRQSATRANASETTMYRSILAAIDGSKISARALDEALRLARENHAELRSLYIVDAPLMAYEAPGYDPSILRDAMLTEGTRVTNEALDRMHRDNVRGVAQVVEADLCGDGIAQRILRVATEMHADLVVVGTHGRRGFQRLMLGSVAERFVRMACCPVLLVPAEHAGAGSSPTRDAVAPVAEPA
jgi:nucleotide-binding universal stress UspA family protein